MYARSLGRFHILSQSIHLIEHHILITIFVGMATLWLVSALLAPSDRQMFTQHAPTRAVSARAFDIERPLTRLDDPQYAYEYDTRAQRINESLERLRNATGADRVYVVSYGYGFSQPGNTFEKKISSTFEINRGGLVPHMLDAQELALATKEHLKSEDAAIRGFYAGLLTRSDGMELHGQYGETIGYLGLEYLQATPSLEENETELLQQTVVSIEADLLLPIDHLNK